MTRRSPEYIQHRQQGAFPNRIDPWGEAGRYFQQIHSGMIYQLQAQLQGQLNALDYQAGKEASLQIFANRKPDLYVQDNQSPPRQADGWDYASVAESLDLSAGVAVTEEEPELEALHITNTISGELVTVIEIISPRNKTNLADMSRYKSQRQQLFLSQHVNVVEIDPTRSIMRLLTNQLVLDHPYHIAIHLPEDSLRVLVSNFDEPLQPFALPLRGEAIRTDPQSAYDGAYRDGAIAGLILDEVRYSIDALPYATLLTDFQVRESITMVGTWKRKLQAIARQNT